MTLLEQELRSRGFDLYQGGPVVGFTSIKEGDGCVVAHVGALVNPPGSEGEPMREYVSIVSRSPDRDNPDAVRMMVDKAIAVFRQNYKGFAALPAGCA